ncbi:hypothetical protein CVT25_007783 [Psilocybe cyanescens]|uniref:Uncharacterized protein n=1 Tax=Psilocybe cyanescens TaxID=93625 RepID=A0A409XVN0_PSICY|nr:hypothetical protein CVT25_007783 [Psilocybe cyanescens]
MDSATIEHPPASPSTSTNEVNPDDINDNIGPIPNHITPDFLVRPDRHQVVYNAEERKVLDAHKASLDQMAEIMDVDAPLFESQYRPQVHQMKLYVMEYITKMRKILNPGPAPRVPGGTGTGVCDLGLQFTHNGFPILPQGLDTKSGNLPVKKELDEMIRKYLAKHYSYEPIQTRYPDDGAHDQSDPGSDSDPNPNTTPALSTEKPKQSKKQRKAKGSKDNSKAQNSDGQNVFRIGDMLLQMSPVPDSDPDLSANISLTVDKGKEKAIAPDPDIQGDVRDGSPELVASQTTLFHLPQLYLGNDIHGGHEHPNPWDWATNVGPYPEYSYNTAHSIAAGPSNAEIIMGPFNDNPDDRLDNMAYIRSFSASQNMFHNSQAAFDNKHFNHYHIPNVQDEAFVFNLHDNGGTFANPVAAPLSEPDCDQQQMVAHVSGNVDSLLIHIASHTEPPRTKRKSKTVAPIQSSSVDLQVPIPDLFNAIPSTLTRAGSDAATRYHNTGEMTTQQLDQQALQAKAVTRQSIRPAPDANAGTYITGEITSQ